MLASGALKKYFGAPEKYFNHFGVLVLQGGLVLHQNKTAPLPILLLASGAPETQKIFWCARSAKNILVILVYLCSRPAQGGGAGLERWGFWHSYHQNKTVPEPPLPILLHATFVGPTIVVSVETTTTIVE